MRSCVQQRRCSGLRYVLRLEQNQSRGQGDNWHLLNTLDGAEGLKDWSLDKLPNPNATDHLVFETVHSLLQHWPNTRMRNGHNIVPGTIPKGTLLYHGRDNNKLPANPDWFSADPEHSYSFCRKRGIVNPDHLQGCWHLTLATIRPLKVLYFDGSSAAKIPSGTMDTQDLLIWGVPGSGGMTEEVPRIRALCKWGREFDVDGFVRMEMDFEIMLCDISSGLSVVSFLNIVRPDSDPPNLSVLTLFETINAGSWHNRFPGETRIQLDLLGLVSFYDTQLVPSLVPIRAGQERWDHRVANTSNKDISAVKSRLEATLTRPADISSRIDWKTLIQVIVDRFAERLELTRYLLNLPATSLEEIIDRANKTQAQLRVMLTPYFHLSAVPPEPLENTPLDWTIPIYKYCATTHTSFMEILLGSMTESEKLILQAIRGTSREICRVVTKMWATGVYAGIDGKFNVKESLDVAELHRLRDTWAEDLERLVAWLDWSVWVKCNPACGPMEMCFLPTWPVGFPGAPNNRLPHPLDSDTPQERLFDFDSRHIVKRDVAEEVQITVRPEPNQWIRPHPRCIDRVHPYEF
ncbi:hypothetical protein JVU11DRAFT_4019 [Chiua virens]|nr:hypothetical protein JVU11DRAFT_4019 [Chiua virens]